MSVVRYRKLIEALENNTAEKTIEWKRVGDASVLQTRIGAFVIQIADSMNSRSLPTVVIYLLNSSGDLVDRFDDEDIEDGGSPGYFSRMTTLLENAGRQASGADEALDTVLRDLDDLLSF